MNSAFRIFFTLSLRYCLCDIFSTDVNLIRLIISFYRSSGSMHPGLSVSHDSVFHSPNSGSDMELDAAESSSSLSISQPFIDQRLQVSGYIFYNNL